MIRRRGTAVLGAALLAFGLLPALAHADAVGDMNTARFDGIGILLHTGKVLVAFGAPPSQATAELYDPATGTWAYTSATGASGRWAHAAVMLRDGRVLVIGGATSTIDTPDCRIYDPVQDLWSPTGNLDAGRQHHTATLLNDGRVLVAGGANTAATPHPDAWLYDPGTGAWTPTGPMTMPRMRHGAVLLDDGKVLVAGGATTGPTDTPTAEIYDPGTGLWSATGSMAWPRELFALVGLTDGTVLAAGESGTPVAEIYDPGAGDWTVTGALAESRRYPSATLLPSGKVLLAGGHDGTHLATTEIYDPVLKQWTSGPPMQAPRRRHSATMLPGGRVLIAGGQNPANLATAEVLDVDDPTWSAGGTLAAPRREHSATLLTSGKVLLIGGVNSSDAEVYDPDTDTSVPTSNSLTTQRWRHSTTLLRDGRVLLAGTVFSSAASKTAELYDPVKDEWEATGPMSEERQQHTATLLPCGQVLVAGGRSPTGTTHASAERYDPVTGTWSDAASMGEGRWQPGATLLRDGRVLVTGGWNSGDLATAEIYDPAADSWTPTAGNMANARYSHRSVLLPSGKVLIGGGNGTFEFELFDPQTGFFTSLALPGPGYRTGYTMTLLPNGRVLVAGGFWDPAEARVFDPATETWASLPNLVPDRDEHTATLLLDGRVLLAGGDSSPYTSTAILDIGRGENPTWRPDITGATDPLVQGTPLGLSGTGFQGQSEGSTGQGYMHSATNYPLVQLHRLDNDQVEWLPVGVQWSDVAFASAAVNSLPPGPTRVTVFSSGIPSESKILDVQCPAPTITSPPLDQVVCLGGSTTLNVAAAEECVAWQWRKGGADLAEGAPYTGTHTSSLSITGATLGEAGVYDAVAELACSATTTTSATAAVSVVADLSSVTATPGSPTSVCSTCTGPTITEAHADGGPVGHQWGYRTQSLGTIIPMPGRTAATYQVNGGDFPGVGSYYLVVETTPTCGPTVVSNEIPVDVTAAPPGDDILYFTVTSRDSENVLEWVNPVGYDTVRVRYTIGDPCAYPVNPLSDGILLGDKTGTDGGPDKLPHGTLVNDTPYCYTVFVDTGGGYSTGRSNRGRPFDTSGDVKWAFSTGVFTLAAPTVGADGVIATSNDYVVHSMARGLGGGEWAAGWRPVQLGGKVEGRSPVVPVTLNSVNPVALLGAFDGRVYAIDSAAGAAGTAPWTSPPIGTQVSAAPAAMFTAFGGAYDYVLVGTRNPLGTDNRLVALSTASGLEVGAFANGGGSGNRIGAIAGMATVDYPTRRVYFASMVDGSGTASSLWALDLGGGPVFTPAWQRALGSLQVSPVLMGGRLYVDGPALGGTVYSIDAASGSPGLDRTLNLADGPIKGFLFPDRANDDLWCATDNAIWGVHDDGASLTVKFGAGFTLDTGVVPTSPVLFIPGSHYVYVGGSDGKLYELDTLGPSMKSVLLGDGQAAVGAPSLDWQNDLIHVGTEAGVFYAVEIPLGP